MSDKQTPPLFGQLVKMYREYAHLSQQALSEAMHETAARMTAADSYTQYKGVTREQINRWETSKEAASRPNTLKVLAQTLADALVRAGYRTDFEDVYRRLTIGQQPVITRDYVSWQAAKLDALIHLLPESEQETRWQVIYSWIEAEYRVWEARLPHGVMPKGHNDNE